MSDTSAGSNRAGFWRRFLAILIDLCLITLALAAIGLLLFAPTGGAIRVTNTLINSESCSEAELPKLNDLNLILPDNFRASRATRCAGSVLGYVHDRSLVLSEVSQNGAVTYTRKVRIPTDSEWRPMHAFNLDDLTMPLLALYLILTQWRFGRTLGMRQLNVAVRSLSGERPTLWQVIKRVLVLFVPVGFGWAGAWLGLNHGFDGVRLAIVIVALLASITFVINIILAASRRRLPWHDRFAGTEVISGTVKP